MTNFVNHRGHYINYMYDDDFWNGLKAWEPETFDVLDKYLGQGKVFLDIGAWNGIFSLYAASLGATAYAVEPDPVAYDKLRKNVSLNSSNVKTFGVAISDHTGTEEIRNKSECFGNSMSSLTKRYDEEVSMIVRSYSLEDFMKIVFLEDHKIDLIKMDVEGSEGKIIPAAVKILEKLKCPLHLSLHPFWMSADEAINLGEAITEVYGVKTGLLLNSSLNIDHILFVPK